MTDFTLTKIVRIILSVLLLAIVALLVIFFYQHRHKPAPAALPQAVSSPLPAVTTVPQPITGTALPSNPLAPYIVYDALAPRLDTLPVADVESFLTQFADTPLADKLRKQWLHVLALKQAWQLFIQYYQPYPDADMRCLYATALWKTQQYQTATDLAATLWMVPYSQVSECNDVFVWWIDNHQLTTDMVWQRFHLAFTAKQLDLASYLVTLLPADQQPRAQLWLRVRSQPQLINNPTVFPLESEQYNDLLAYGIERMALNSANNAATAWNNLQRYHHFTADQVQQVVQAIAVGFIKQDHTQADAWLKQINPEYINEIALSWRLRLALEDKNWSLLEEWINQLPEKKRNDSQWQYWYARAMEQQGRLLPARVIYKQLAQKRDYYGFLAASRIGVPFTINNQQQTISKTDIDTFFRNPAIQRMLALYAIAQVSLGNDEWWYAIKKMNAKQRYVAVTMAEKWKLYAIALKSLSYLSDHNDLTLRYPKIYWRNIKKQADALGIDPAFIYAIIRQESLFNPNAVSYVGAQGLMQVMPSTAKMLLEQDKDILHLRSTPLTNPALNIRLGSLYLHKLLEKNNNNPALVATAYNAGPGRLRQWLATTDVTDMDMWIDSIPYTETRNYVKRVITNMVIYQSLLGYSPTLADVLETKE